MAKKRQVSEASKPVNKGGRPRVIFDDEETLNKLKTLAAGQHTQLEAAAMLGVSLATFEGFLRSSAKAREVWDEGRGHGQGSLRRMQFVAAEKGSVPMQIWLGKQYLAQKDKAEVENKHEIGESIKELWAALGAQRRGLIDGT